MDDWEATFKVNRIQILFPADLPESKTVLLCCLRKYVPQILLLRKEARLTCNYHYTFFLKYSQ